MKITPTDSKIEVEGAELNYMGVKLKVARSGNINFKKVFKKLMKPYDADFEAGRMSEEKSNEVIIECYAESILVGWESFKDMNGKEYEYSKQNAIEFLTDDEDAYKAISAFSKTMDNYLIEKVENLKGK